MVGTPFGGAKTSAAALSELGAATVVLWAPTDRDALLRIQAGYQRFATTSDDPSQLCVVLLLPYESLPFNGNVSDILDLWWHPVLEDRWKPFRAALTFWRGPVNCVDTGSAGPLHQCKHLAALRLSPQTRGMQVEILSWRPIVAQVDASPFLQVDVQADQAAQLHRILLRAGTFGIRCWEGPLRSSASTSSQRWLTFRGHLTDASSTSLAAQMIMHALRRTPDLPPCLIGYSAMFSDKGALLADTCDPASLFGVSDITDGILTLSPSRALVVTSATQTQWEVMLTELQQRDAAHCIMRLKWQPSQRSGRTWVKPALLDRDLRASCIRAEPARAKDLSDPKSALLVNFCSPWGADPDQLLIALVEAITSRLGLCLAQGTIRSVLQPGQRLGLRDGEGRWNGWVAPPARIAAGGDHSCDGPAHVCSGRGRHHGHLRRSLPVLARLDRAAGADFEQFGVYSGGDDGTPALIVILRWATRALGVPLIQGSALAPPFAPILLLSSSHLPYPSVTTAFASCSCTPPF